MPLRSDERLDGLLRDVLGYVNLSSGRRDPSFLERLDSLARLAAAASAEPVWPQISALLRERIETLAGSSTAFTQVEQARAVVPLVFDVLWPAYRGGHPDLLAHQTDAALLTPFFVGRMFEAVLAQGGPWEERERIVAGALDDLNDFLGYRPVAVLRTPQKIEPYPREWVGPLPLFVRGAGVASGPYEGIIGGALEILRTTPPELLHEASFDLERLDELALDPRAYDFEHPVNKRPNHQFGEWDPHSVDQRGYYRRFVLREPLLAALARWVEAATPTEHEERLFDASAVTAGTILMASGTSGWGPEAHDSTASLAKLVGRIAAYRDAFYARLLAGATGPREKRLKAEAAELRQPFGAVRGFLNAELARERAEQLALVHVALLFAQLGDRASAEAYVATVPTPAARLQAQIECQLTTARQALTARRPSEALPALADAEALLKRGISCGAFADPWSILGFQGHFSLFPAVENSVRDPRVDQLCRLVQGLMSLGVDAWTGASAAGDAGGAAAAGAWVHSLASWWDEFATADVSGVNGFVAADMASSAEEVSSALVAAAEAETAGREPAFWRARVHDFDGPATYSLALSALVAQGQLNAAMGLLVLWLLHREDAPLEQGEASFERWATRWLADTLAPREPATTASPENWNLAAKFFDFLEANAEEYWNAPQLQSKRLADSLEFKETPELDDDEEESEEDDLFSAAYENVSYRDSTRDGVEGDMLEGGSGTSGTEGELDFELQRLNPHLSFLVCLARLWRRAVAALGNAGDQTGEAIRERLSGWRTHAEALERDLLELLGDVQRHPLGAPLPTREAMVEHDRQRGVRDTLVDRVQRAVWEVSLARMSLTIAEPKPQGASSEPPDLAVLRALSTGDPAAMRAGWGPFLETLAKRPVLYVPVGKGGDPQRALAARQSLAVLGAIADRLPRAGMLVEACQLLDAVLERERGGAPGAGAVSEFDRFFEAIYRALLQTLLQTPAEARSKRKTRSARDLVELVQRWNHALLNRWLTHSRLVRLSSLERVAAPARWQELVTFVRRHGLALFAQSFFNYGHLRSIRHLGVDRWLEQMAETPDAEDDFPLLADLDRGTPRKQAVEVLGVVVESISEYYGYYREYNGTTTQSDRGDNLYMLLDFLRLVASYDRICWNMRPLVAAHEVLLDDGDGEAAALWRQSLTERTAEAADTHLKRYAELVREYGFRLPSVFERLSERFVRSLAIDRLKSLIVPAMAEARVGSQGPALTTLKEEINELLEAPAGSGVEAPAWITSLLDEVAERSAAYVPAVTWSEEFPRGPRASLTWEQIVAQLEAWEDTDEA